MYWAAILAALFLAPLAPGSRHVAGPISGSALAQAAGTPEESPQQPAPDPAKASGDAKPPEDKIESSEKKLEESNPQNGPVQPPATSIRKPRRRARKAVALPATEGEPRKIVIHKGGTSEPVAQILPGMTLEEANRQRESASQLLAAAESSLQELAVRSLSQNQQAIVVQIRQYLDGARSALKENDTQRAHTLAQKAYLLADDLVKH